MTKTNRFADKIARMRAGATQVESVERHRVLRRTADRARKQELIQCQFAVVPVPARDAKLLFDVDRGQHFGCVDALFKVRHGLAERFNRKV